MSHTHTLSFTHDFVTHSLSHTTLSHTPFKSHTTLSHTHTIFHTQLCHKLSFTHNFVTHHLAHTRTTLSHTTLSHATLSHTLFHTHIFVTHSLSHTTLSHTIFHTQLCHTLSFTHTRNTHTQAPMRSRRPRSRVEETPVSRSTHVTSTLFAGTASLLFAVLLGRPTNLASWQGTCAVAAAAALVLWRLLWRPCFDEDLDCHKGSPGFSTLSVDSLDWFIDLILLVFWEQNSSWHSVDFTLCTFDRFVFFGFAAILLGTSPLLDNAPFGEGFLGCKLAHIVCMVCFFFVVNTIFNTFRNQPDREHTLTASRSQFRAVPTIRGSWILWIFFLHFLTFSARAPWSEGYAVDMGSVGAEGFRWRLPAKEHVEELQSAFESLQTSTNRSIKKRSFKRALKRAETHGYTMYKGQMYTAQRLGTEYKGHPTVVPKTQNNTPSSKLKTQTVLMPQLELQWSLPFGVGLLSTVDRVPKPGHHYAPGNALEAHQRMGDRQLLCDP